MHRIEPYPTSIVMHLRGCQVDSIKLKTPSSYAIRELVVYYRNYSSIKRRMMEEGYSEIIGEFVGNWQDKLSCE